jgi:hypothetical protein
MAKSASVKAPSRIRFVMLEAELPDGDLGQITQAIQNAIRVSSPNNGLPRAVTSLSTRPTAATTDTDAETQPESGSVENAEGVEESVVASARARGPRKLRTPKVLDLDLTTEPSFESFAGNKKPSSDLKRFLVVAAWFKLHRQTDTITADHVYTCYRKIKWPSAIDDFGQPLRDLKRVQFVEMKNKGLYAINHLGLAEVDKLGND